MILEVMDIRKEFIDLPASFKWPDHLTEERLWHVLFRHAVMFRLAVPRHVKRTEDDIEEGKGRGEILIETLILRRVMPAMKHRAGEDIAEDPKAPVEVGVHHRGVDHVDAGH